jgi:hypothetical protein
MTWTKNEIRMARKKTLAPILVKKGYRLTKMPGENYRLDQYGDLVVKEHYWIWKKTGQTGNTIDFFISVEKLTFKEAMKTIMTT